nr:hypothetical protein Iba_chr02bCG15510 [Ipomoea batatas]
MYPYLDFFNEPETQEMEYMNDLEAGDQDLRSHLNARTGSERAHPAEPLPQEPIDIIHEHTPQYYPHPPPYQFQPGVFSQPAYFPIPGVSPTPVNLELRRVQSERRSSMPYPTPPMPSRGPPEAQMDSIDGTEYDSPPRRSAFERLRPSTREHLGVREEGRRFVDRPISSYRGDSESSSSASSTHLGQTTKPGGKYQQ